ncbi:MAG: hypothetical protein JNK76_06460 [Planctomycetales bacterium]|nr:hypothetical protein [Planctomycetales bacterium]MBN8628933.1 hypothetical protein [Planctomycetota bacterium]
MSMLLSALEKLDYSARPIVETRRPAAPQPVVASTLVAEPLGPVYVPPVNVTPVPVSAPVVEEPAVGTRRVAPLRGIVWSEAATGILELFPAPALLTAVGCGLSFNGAIDVEQLAGALAMATTVPVELLEPEIWNDAERLLAARRSVLKRGVLAIGYLTAEAAVKRHALLAQTGGVLLLVEAGATEARAADVVATTLRMQGVGVRGTVLLS